MLAWLSDLIGKERQENGDVSFNALPQSYDGAHRCSDSYFDLKKHVVCIKMLLFRTVNRTSKLGHDRLAWCR